MFYLLKLAYFTVLDVVYVLFWQAVGLLRGNNSKSFSLSADTSKIPIIIIPGVFEAWHFMRRLAARLNKAGHPVHLLDELGYNDSGIPLSALALKGFIDSLKADQVIIIGHSKGGLIGKYLLSQYDMDKKVRHLIAVNTPFNGSIYAHLLWLRSFRVFRPNSKVIKLLRKDTASNKKITSIYSRFDPYIPGKSFLEGAENIQLDTIGHFRILDDGKLHRAISGTISRLS